MKAYALDGMTRRQWEAATLDDGESLRSCGHWGGESETCPLCGPPLSKPAPAVMLAIEPLAAAVPVMETILEAFPAAAQHPAAARYLAAKAKRKKREGL